MTLRSFRLWTGLFCFGSATILALVGCSKNDSTEKPVPPLAIKTASEVGEKKSPTSRPTLSKEEIDRLHQPFKTAVLLDPPEGEQRPPDLTSAGKSVGKIFEMIAGKNEVGGIWDQIRFVNSANQLIRYRAAVKTSLGEILIDLDPEAAPNHCRNFIALARAQYFDGLPFYRSVNQKEEDQTIAFVESGCPKGNGEYGYGSIGYWLKPEINKKRTHEEGALGASHREEIETASCRFYITAQRMPQMDESFTVYGKVVQGLDVVRTMNQRPVQTGTDLLQEPVSILKVDILTFD